MKTKLIFITILGLILFGVLFMQYGHVPSIDCVIPLAISIVTFIITGFIQFQGSILVAVFGFIALGLYIYLTVILNRRKSQTEKH